MAHQIDIAILTNPRRYSDIDKRSRAPADRPRFARGLARYVDFLSLLKLNTLLGSEALIADYPRMMVFSTTG